MSLETEEFHLRGTPISQGIAIGKPFYYQSGESPIQEITLSTHEVSNEVLRYRRAVEQSKEDIRFLQNQLEKENVLEGAAILESHLSLIEDPEVTHRVEEEIETSCKNAEYIFSCVIKDFQEKFGALADPFFRERFKDVQDISRRVLGHLQRRVRNSLKAVPTGSIIFAKELIASDIAEATCHCHAFVSEYGGMTSHAAIVSKAKGIPYVSNVDFSKINFEAIETVIVDGTTGDILFNPSEKLIQHYQKKQEQFLTMISHLDKAAPLPAETYDGYSVTLSANIEMVNELDVLHQHNNSGVGLFRSEYLFLARDDFPSEEDQFENYRILVEGMNELPVVIRTFDIGGDKYLPNQKGPIEENPFLGCRAIRFLLKELAIFKTQLRAILRASAYGNIRLLFPMVSSLSELRDAKAVVKEVAEELCSQGVQIDPSVKIGCMIEVPSAALIADLLAQECDFLSIGTNDLVQYALAVDRSNHAMSGLYTPAHPSVIRLIKLVVAEAHAHGIPVSVCGEVAGDPRFTPLLLGLGVNELSVTLRYLPLIKNTIRHTSIIEAQKLAEEVLTLSTPQEIEKLLTTEFQKIAPEELIPI